MLTPSSDAPSANESKRAWMRLPSGKRLDLIHPSPSSWTDHDLAVRLSRTARWGGESRWEQPLSVAQHSLLVLEIRRQWAHPAPLTVDHQLRELLHDAEEGLLGFDCIAPLKGILGSPFAQVSSKLMAAVSDRYQLQPWQTEEWVEHKRADVIAAAAEAVHCVGRSRVEVHDVLKIDAAILDQDPLAAKYGDPPWQAWPMALAAFRFEAELEALLSLRLAVPRPTK